MIELDYILKIISAILVGFIIGFEREKADKDAGIKTNIFVALGACIFTILSLENATELSDPTRIAAQVVSGIGFLGAGAIIKNNLTAKGLTTASIIWFSASMGMVIGFGNILLAIICTIIIQIVLFIVKKIEKNWLK